jgi:hypothetical protein
MWHRYSTGLGAIVLGGAVVILLLPPAQRPQAGLGATIALLLQAPLGWWVLRSIGTPRFQLIWTVSMGIRLLAVAATALVLIPWLGWDATAVLGSLVVALLMLLLAEAVTAVRENS